MSLFNALRGGHQQSPGPEELRRGDLSLPQERVQFGDGLGDIALHVNRLHA